MDRHVELVFLVGNIIVEYGRRLYRYIRGPRIPDLGNILDDIKCRICYDIRYRQRVLQCGHSVCENCLPRLPVNNEQQIQCPNCRRSHQLPENGVAGLPVNFVLADLQTMLLELRGLPAMEQPLSQNGAAVARAMPYRFCLLSEGRIDILTDAIEAILDQLERERIDGDFVKGYWHERDDVVGTPIIENITNSIQNSNFVLLLIHPANIRHEWWKMKRYMSLIHRMNNPQHMSTIIPIFIDDPEDPLATQDIPLEIQVLHGLTYNSNSNAEFWRKLKNSILGREEGNNIL